jgi:hypothetical protein
MELNTDQDSLMLSPFLVSGNVGFKLPAVADWGERSDVTSVDVASASVQPSGSDDHAYLVIETEVYFDGEEEPVEVWACSCPQWHYRERADDPREAGECKHIRAESKVSRAQADEDQVQLGGSD